MIEPVVEVVLVTVVEVDVEVEVSFKAVRLTKKRLKDDSNVGCLCFVVNLPTAQQSESLRQFPIESSLRRLVGEFNLLILVSLPVLLLLAPSRRPICVDISLAIIVGFVFSFKRKLLLRNIM